ncbi:exosome complex protein LRP1, partial [Tremellales sp. Uapishka_1]
MSSQTPQEDVDPAITLRQLVASFKDLEGSLAPLLKSSWEDTTSSMSLLERSKLDITVGYAVNDLIWSGCILSPSRGVIWLRSWESLPEDEGNRAREPRCHARTGKSPSQSRLSDGQELTGRQERIKSYYSKIKAVEEPDSGPSSRIDQSAAKRFVTASIPAAQRLPTSSAQGIATAQRDARLEEERFGTSNRFRFIQAGGEKVVPAAQSDDGVEEVRGAVEAEAFLRSVEDEMEIDGERNGKHLYSAVPTVIDETVE